jgi:membrane protein DedA with SNARE-associated domain
MHWAKFVLFNAIGAALWVAVWTTVGYTSGSHINSVYAAATRYGTYLAIVVGVLIVAYLARRIYRFRAARANPPQDPPPRKNPA